MPADGGAQNCLALLKIRRNSRARMRYSFQSNMESHELNVEVEISANSAALQRFAGSEMTLRTTCRCQTDPGYDYRPRPKPGESHHVGRDKPILCCDRGNRS